MTEYIKKEDAIAHPFANGHYDKANANRDFIRGHESYKEWLEDLPAADVRENVRGEWLNTADPDAANSTPQTGTAGASMRGNTTTHTTRSQSGGRSATARTRDGTDKRITTRS